MTLTLVSAEHDHVVYVDGYGDTILMTLGPIAAPLVYWDELDLAALWQDAIHDHQHNPPARWSYRPDRETFAIRVRQTVADMDAIDVVWCEDCDDPVKRDECESVNGGDDLVCTGCYDENYRGCDDCGNTVHYENLNGTLHDESVCQRCIDYRYSYCEDCDGYYHYDYADGHDHNGGCDCESPAQTFTMRNDGEAPVAQDERVTIALPSGVISEEGIHSIVRLIRDHYYNLHDADEGYEIRSKWWTLSSDVYGMDARWQTKEGNFTKRLSKLAHKNHGLKVPPAMISAVGNIARDNSNGSEVALEFTRNLNLSAEDFYHEDSCWWQSYAASRCALKTNGGIGMRTFGGRYDRVTGRAWVMPLRADEDGNLTPTFDSLTPDAFVVFNGYGELSGYTPARIVAHMAGMTYRKIGFSCSPMYVNGDGGYLVASEEIASKYTDGNLNLYVDTHSTLHHRETSAALIDAA